MPPYVLVLTTWPHEKDATTAAGQLVAARLAACVSIISGLQSVYTWQGQTQVDREHQLVIKTTRDQVVAIGDWMKANHPYDTPEFLVLPVVDGAPSYLAWIGASTLRKADA